MRDAQLPPQNARTLSPRLGKKLIVIQKGYPAGFNVFMICRKWSCSTRGKRCVGHIRKA